MSTESEYTRTSDGLWTNIKFIISIDQYNQWVAGTIPSHVVSPVYTRVKVSDTIYITVEKFAAGPTTYTAEEIGIIESPEFKQSLAYPLSQNGLEDICSPIIRDYNSDVILGRIALFGSLQRFDKMIENVAVKSHDGKYGDTAVSWRDTIMPKQLSLMPGNLTLVVPGSGLFVMLMVRSIFSWRGFDQSQFILYLTDLHIRCYLKPKLEMIVRGCDENFILEYGMGTDGNYMLQYVAADKQFEIQHNNGELIIFPINTQGGIAIIEWLQHLVNYFHQEKEKAV